MKEIEPIAVGQASAEKLNPSEPNSTTTKGLRIPHYFTRPGSDPYREVTWELRTASIGNEQG